MIYQVCTVSEILIWYCTRLLPKIDLFRWENTLKITWLDSLL